MNKRVLETEEYHSKESAKAYNEVAERYMPLSQNWTIEQALNYGSRTGSILDVGAGTGQMVTCIAGFNCFDEVVALDMSELMLESARENARSAGVEHRIKFVQADSRKLPFPDGYFETVVCHNTMHHFDEPEKLITEIIRVTKPGGQFFIRDITRPNKFFMGLIEHVILAFAGPSKSQSIDSIKAALSFEEMCALAQKFPDLVAVRKGPVHTSIQRKKTLPVQKHYIKVGPWWARPFRFFAA